MVTIHRAAAAGFAAGSETYVKGRPDYPPELNQWLRAALHLAPGKTVLDLGAGTGKFMATLQATGVDIIAVEPVAEMLSQLQRRHPGIDARAGTADRIPLPDASVAAVVCAQAFHWFATPQALAEIRRVLEPGGVLGLVWNVRDEAVSWVAALTKIMAPYVGNAPRYATMQWRQQFPAVGFSGLSEETFPHGHTGTPGDVIEKRVLSVSFIAELPQGTRDQIAADIRAVIARAPGLVGREVVTFPYLTAAFSCVKLA